MNYLLDSNTISDFFNKSSSNHHKIFRNLTELSDEDRVFVSVITLYELEYGYCNAPESKKEIVRKIIKETKEDFIVLPLSVKGSEYFGMLKKSFVDKRKLKKEGAKKHNIDLILASMAILNSCVLVSEDSIYLDLGKQESRLIIENWAK